MKVRHGFVSNSSSSSFYCVVCGTEKECYDTDSLYTQDMCICPTGHVMHFSHIMMNNMPTGFMVYNIYKLISPVDILGYSYQNETSDDTPDKCVDVDFIESDIIELTKTYIQQRNTNTDETLYEFLVNMDPNLTEALRSKIPIIYCPICQGREIEHDVFNEFLLMKCGFENYQEAVEYILSIYKNNEGVQKEIRKWKELIRTSMVKPVQ